MEISVHLRGGRNLTNVRAEAFARGAKALGHEVRYASRAEAPLGDLAVQVGFNRSTTLEGAIFRGIPFLILEASVFRTLCPWETWSSFGYNGLAGNAYRPEPLDDVRPSPTLQAPKEEGGTLILAQKPTDHSLRGHDHVSWLQEKLREYPEARIRHHPTMVVAQDTIEQALELTKEVITYTSTAAVDAAIAGCRVHVEGSGCWWDTEEPREEQVHRLSWAQFRNSELGTPEIAEYILSGYEGALEHPYEQPRYKVNGQAICERYNRELLRGAAQERA